MSTVDVARSRVDRDRARRVVEGHLRELEGPVVRAVMGRLRQERKWLAIQDVEAAYNQAWHGVYETINQGTTVTNLTGLLVSITYMRTIDAYRSRHQARHSPVGLLEEQAVIDVDLAEHIDDQLLLNRLLVRLSERLTEKELGAIALCVLRGYPRAQAAKQLGLTDRGLKKILASANKKLAGIVTMMQTRGCGDEEWTRALRSYALGTLAQDSPDHERITNHLSDCQACKRYVCGLRGLTVVFPPVLAFVRDPALSLQLHQLLTQGSATTPQATTATTARAGLSTSNGTTVAAAATASSSGAGAGSAGVLGGGTGGLLKSVVLAGSVLTATGIVGVAAALHVTAGKHAQTPHRPTTSSLVRRPVVSPAQPAVIRRRASTQQHKARRSSAPKHSLASTPVRRTATSTSTSTPVVKPPVSRSSGRVSHEFGIERQPRESAGTTKASSPPSSSSSKHTEEEFGPHG